MKMHDAAAADLQLLYYDSHCCIRRWSLADHPYYRSTQLSTLSGTIK